MDLLELKALNNKIDTRRGHDKLTKKFVASVPSVLAVDTSPEQVKITHNIGLVTHVTDTKKWIFRCGSNEVFSQAVHSWIKIADLVNNCVNRLFSINGRLHASLR